MNHDNTSITTTTTSKFTIHYTKPKMIDLVNFSKNTPTFKNKYNPFAIQQLQLYNPIYKKFFEMKSTNHHKIALNHPLHVVDANHVGDTEHTCVQEKPVFVKYSPLLDPFRYMIGKYNVHDPSIRTMPSLDSTEETVFSKILSPNNASYVDCFFNYLSCSLLHKHGFVHGVDFYGSYLGVQEWFRVAVTDDLDYLRGSSFFTEHSGKSVSSDKSSSELFYVDYPDQVDPDEELNAIGGSRRNKRALQFLDEKEGDDLLLDVISLTHNDQDDDKNQCEGEVDEVTMTGLNTNIRTEFETVYTKETRSIMGSSSSSSLSSSSSSTSNSDLNYSSDDDDEDDEEDKNDGEDEDEEEWATDTDETPNSDEEEEEEDEEQEVYGYIRNFPIQMICMEKCDGTLDELFVRQEMNTELCASVLFQVIMTLLFYQKAFKFTHNDLHTNNIMYKNTDQEYLIYKFQDKVYRVPTHGKIFKIIDFGRGIYRFQNQLFCSDSFAAGGDAHTQYNFEPFMNSNKPRLEPNFGFDLCRLGSSIFDFIMDLDLKCKDMDPLQETIHRWCSDDNGKNVLYKKNGEERYPNFKLYKMIARTSHKHIPENQLEFPYFKQFLVKEAFDKGANIMDLDSLPCYV